MSERGGEGRERKEDGMKGKSWVGLVVAATLVGASGAQSQASDVEDPVSLPEGIVWETNYDDPPIGSPDAIRGGTFNYMLGAYPLTFRLMGPNANDAFAGWNRQFTMYFRPIILHPATGNFIPWLATHWSVQDDGRTIYLKLDPDARFSDGEPITADDYVFTWKMWSSEHVIDPYYNTYGPRVYESVDKIDDYTLRVVGTRPSWRPLWDYVVDLPLWPTPAHATVLDEGWLDRVNNEPQLAIGPYVVTEVSRGESVTFERIEDWWGDGKYYFQGSSTSIAFTFESYRRAGSSITCAVARSISCRRERPEYGTRNTRSTPFATDG